MSERMGGWWVMGEGRRSSSGHAQCTGEEAAKAGSGFLGRWVVTLVLRVYGSSRVSPAGSSEGPQSSQQGAVVARLPCT